MDPEVRMAIIDLRMFIQEHIHDSSLRRNSLFGILTEKGARRILDHLAELVDEMEEDYG